ncbi:MAG: hypothetical protein HQ559_00255 [Lentisphaerae bacterium]|nr:hypothetical protein [Lentisphaerota bacterium]
MGGYDCVARHGRCFVAEVRKGQIPAGAEIVYSFSHTRSPWIANQRPGETDHEGSMFVRVNGKECRPFPTFRVLPDPMYYQRVIVPSSARPGEWIRVQLVSLDAYNNLSSTHFENVSVKLGERVLAEGLSYTGRGEVEVSISEEGVHRLEADGVMSNPIRVTSKPCGPYWGDIHFHNYPSVDAIGNTPYEYARDVSCLDFAATAEHGAGGLTEHWEQTRKWCREWHQPGRFVTILGVEANIDWHLNAYHHRDDAPRIEAQANGDSRVSPEEMVAYLKDNLALAQIHHSGWGYDMRKRYPDETRLIEIYSMHGSSECYDPDSPLSLGNQRHRPGDDHKGPCYARDAWALGQRFVTHGSSDNHFGQAGVRYDSATAAYTHELTRDSILNALKQGACYATTGERILLGFSANEHPMGIEFHASAGDKIAFRVEASGTDILDRIDVFRAFFIEGKKDVLVDELRFDEGDPAVEEARGSWETVFSAHDIGALDYEGEWQESYAGRRSVYYVRVSQKEPITLPTPLEGHPVKQARPVCAWSSPVWILPA